MRFGDSAGKVLGGRYLLIAPIGRGASGDVYLAQDRTLGRKVAIKLLHANLAGDPVFTKRFRAEANAAAALNHPSIMRVFDWGESSGTPYLVLEFLSGGSLREYIAQSGVLDPPQTATLALQTAQGLSYAHAKGYVHRDLKPANLLFDEEGRVRIADFGLARSLSEAAWTEPVGVLIGTARYASPELALGLESSAASDIYSFGLVIYEAMVGRIPFSGDTTVSILMSRIGANVEPPEETSVLSDLIRSCCRAEPSERISTTELLGELERLVRRLDPPKPLSLIPQIGLILPGSEPELTTISPADPVLVDGSPNLLTSSVVAANGGPDLFDLEDKTDLVGSALSLNASEEPPTQERETASVEAGKTAGVRRRRGWRVPALIAAGLVIVLFAGAVGDGLIKIFPPVKVQVPSVSATELSFAKTELVKAGLVPEVSSRIYSSTVPDGAVITEQPRAGTYAVKGSAVQLVVSLGHGPVEIPVVSNLTVSQAESKLRSAGLGYSLTQAYSETVLAGTVISYQPSSGSAPYRSVVQLTVSKGPALRQIPDLGGMSSQQATQELQQLRLVAVLVNTYSDTVPVGTVISTSPPAGAFAARGSTVTVSVSQGPHLVQVPNVLGDTIAAAKAALANVGLTVSVIYGPANATRALGTNPPAATTVHYGTSVSLYAF